MDIFEQKGIQPMLIADMQEPFSSKDFIYELKVDGERCVAYLDKNSTTIQNKRGVSLNPRCPELTGIHKAANEKCILDGELAVLVNGKPAFSELQRRSLLSNRFRVELAAKQYPACFTAFDILYYRDRPVMDRPLTERKAFLSQTVHDADRLAVSRWIEEKGIELYNAASKQGLEGVVAKRKGSLYFPGKRTKDWVKFKNLKDDDFVVCGYIDKGEGVVSIILAQYRGEKLIYKGHVTLGVSRSDFRVISQAIKIEPLFETKENEGAIWIRPELVCTVQYMEKTAGGTLRQPVFKGLREDKLAVDCVE